MGVRNLIKSIKEGWTAFRSAGKAEQVGAEAANTAAGAARHEPHLDADPHGITPTPEEYRLLRGHDGRKPAAQQAPTINNAPTTQNNLIPNASVKDLFKLQAAQEGAGLMRGFLKDHPNWRSALGYSTASFAIGAAGFFGGGKILQTIEGGRNVGPGEFFGISTVHYTQGYDLNSSNGSSFAETVEHTRKQRNPQLYSEQYETKLKQGWIPTGEARAEYESIKTDIGTSAVAGAQADAVKEKASAIRDAASDQANAIRDRAQAQREAQERANSQQKKVTDSYKFTM